jgi:formylglycine-generating enzyme required for sulfatase activity
MRQSSLSLYSKKPYRICPVENQSNSGGETHDVAQKHPNTWGLYDMLGNVDEWCHDGEYKPGLAVDPVGQIDAGAQRAIRGGFFGYPALYMRASYRDWNGPRGRSSDIGFRCLSSERSARHLSRSGSSCAL